MCLCVCVCVCMCVDMCVGEGGGKEQMGDWESVALVCCKGRRKEWVSVDVVYGGEEMVKDYDHFIPFLAGQEHVHGRSYPSL